MANIFLQLTNFRFKKEVLQKITGSSTNAALQKAINEFYESESASLSDYADFIIRLVPLTKSKEGKEKLLIALVYFVVHDEVSEEESLAKLEKVLNLNESVIVLAKFFSFVFKSTTNVNIKKWLIKSTVTIIENQPKVSSFASFIEHLDQITGSLNFTNEEIVEIYSKLITYLEKHPVYKKLCSSYIFRSLQKVTKQTAQTPQTNQLIVKAIKYGVVPNYAISLLNHAALHTNQLYPFLEVLLTGDYEKLDLSKLQKIEKEGIVGEDFLRKMKVEAIPRLLANVKIVSYDQVAGLLQIKKQQVSSYIIDAIRQGIIKAKLDEFEETVIVNKVDLRALRFEERAKLQRDITNLCEKLTANLGPA